MLVTRSTHLLRQAIISHSLRSLHPSRSRRQVILPTQSSNQSLPPSLTIAARSRSPTPAMSTSAGAAEDFVHVSDPGALETSGFEPVGITDDDVPVPVGEGRGSSGEEGALLDSEAVSSEEGEGSEQMRVLVEEAMKGVVRLECETTADGGSCEVYLVGTAHVSQESCREVQAIIRYLKPQVVFLELCSSRVAILKPQNLEVPTVREMVDMWKKQKMNAFGILYGWFLAKIADKLEVFPGSEFRVAFEEARSYGAKVILGDRPLQITLRRTWGKMTLWHKTKFMCYMLHQAVFLPSAEELDKMLKEMDDVDMITLLIQEMSKEFPTLMETLLYERDLYMSSTLLKVASEHSSVVAVVGKGHLQGIKKHWQQPVEVKHLLEIPAGSSLISSIKVVASIGAAVTAVAILSGIYLIKKR